MPTRALPLALALLLACLAGVGLVRGGGEPEAPRAPQAPQAPAPSRAPAALPTPVEQEVELGQVRWLRDYAAARAQARREGKPLAVLFDEVPGCATCTGYGERALSHPLVVEALERHAVPVLVRNNVEGAERAILKRFGEPTWANPSLRVVDPKDERTLARVAGDYTSAGLLGALARTLAPEGRPAWLAAHAPLGKPLRTDTFSMHCFWTGERVLGRLPGVVKTRTGWQGGVEVVEVTYAPSLLSPKRLAAAAQAGSCRAAPKGQLRATPQDDKYSLKRTPYRYVPLSPLQASRINALGGQGEAARALLSPAQVELLRLIQAHPRAKWPNVDGVTLPQAWARTLLVARGLSRKAK